jgi:hypothetical protein
MEKGNILRNLSVISQKKEFAKVEIWRELWKQGIVVETVFSCIKRMFGREYVYSVRLKNMIQEMMLKASLYNKLISI